MCVSNLIKQPSSQKPAVIFNEFVKSLRMLRSVIPAKAGIQFFCKLMNSLDSGFHRSDDPL